MTENTINTFWLFPFRNFSENSNESIVIVTEILNYLKEGVKDKPIEIIEMGDDYCMIRGTQSNIKSLLSQCPHNTKFSVTGLNSTNPQTSNTQNVFRSQIIIPAQTITNHLDLQPRVAGGPFSPLDLAEVYDFPDIGGANQTIGIISLGGGFYQSNINTYFQQIGSAFPAPTINAISVNANNNPGVDITADIENTLDIEMIAALCPLATINIYFCTNDQASFQLGVQRAIAGGCKIISISWLGLEYYNASTNDMLNFNTIFQTAANNNISIFVASGDYGSYGDPGLGTNPGDNVSIPSTCQYCTCVGGTSLVAPGNVWTSETAWPGSGGGISKIFSMPFYQLQPAPPRNISAAQSYNLGGFRIVPDVAGFADPNPGFQIYYYTTNSPTGPGNPTLTVGGTSGTAPIYAGLFGMINDNLNKLCGFINPTIYQNVNAFHDITSGSNGSFTARTGWDAVTGLGSPVGTTLQDVFS